MTLKYSGRFNLGIDRRQEPVRLLLCAQLVDDPLRCAGHGSDRLDAHLSAYCGNSASNAASSSSDGGANIPSTTLAIWKRLIFGLRMPGREPRRCMVEQASEARRATTARTNRVTFEAAALARTSAASAV